MSCDALQPACPSSAGLFGYPGELSAQYKCNRGALLCTFAPARVYIARRMELLSTNSAQAGLLEAFRRELAGKARKEKMVGTTGFEPATSPTPRVRDTRLRYVPTGSDRRLPSMGRAAVQPRPSRLSSAFEKRQESAQGIAQIQQHLAVQELLARHASRLPGIARIGASELELRCAVLRIADAGVGIAQVASRAGYGKTFVVQQALDLQHHLHIRRAIQAMAACAFHRLQHGKLRLPVAEHERFQVRHAADFADAVKLFAQLWSGCRAGHFRFLLGGDSPS